jgi:hypothetical protein
LTVPVTATFSSILTVFSPVSEAISPIFRVTLSVLGSLVVMWGESLLVVWSVFGV